MVNNKFRSFRMGFNYKLAEEIVNCFNLNNPSEIIDNLTCLECSDSTGIIQEIFRENINALLKPDKHTLLHSFCEQYLYYYLMHERWFLLDEVCDDFEANLIIKYLKRTANILNEYGVDIRNYAHEIYLFDKKYEMSDYELDYEYKNLVREIFDDMLAHFEEIEGEIIEATFYLLYDNKEFLFKFNKYLSQFTTNSYLSDSCFDENNHIKRTKYIPEWLKRAVFYRDRGKCQHCGKDLSGQLIVAGDGELQFDHVIPLESGGTNDATNFQLLCNRCNLGKSGQLYLPNYFYQMYW
jgi:hypothetical protein